MTRTARKSGRRPQQRPAAAPADKVMTKRDRRRALVAARREAARRRTRRRRLLIALVVVVVVGLGTGGIIYATRPPSITVSGAFGKTPAVTIPDMTPPSTLQVHQLISGHGPRVAKGDLAVTRLTAYTWDGSSHAKIKELSTAKPQPLTVGQTLTGLDKGLEGAPAGSRLLITIPPKDGFGSKGNSQLKVTGKDSLVVVADVLGTYSKTATVHGTRAKVASSGLPTVGTASPAKAPPVHIPHTAAPTTLQVKTLIQGKGPAVKKGQLLIAQYEGVIWDTSKVFDSSWEHGAPAGFQVSSGQVITGWVKGLVGKRVGSQVLLVVPPADGYGSKGNSSAGIKGTDTLVFVVDILGAY